MLLTKTRFSSVYKAFTQPYLHYVLARELMYFNIFYIEATVNVVPNVTGWSRSKRKCHILMRVAFEGGNVSLKVMISGLRFG